MFIMIQVTQNINIAGNNKDLVCRGNRIITNE